MKVGGTILRPPAPMGAPPLRGQRLSLTTHTILLNVLSRETTENSFSNPINETNINLSLLRNYLIAMPDVCESYIDVGLRFVHCRADMHVHFLPNILLLLREINYTVSQKVRHLMFVNWQMDRFSQELSYRKQIARELRTQYVEAFIVSNPVTLKSELKDTQGQ